MNFYLIGLNYKSAPLEARERAYGKRKEIDDFLVSRRAGILYTCNRIEVYGIAEDLFEAQVLTDDFRLKFKEFADYGYIKSGQVEVFRHLLRLASGLESQIKGEAQILEQLSAWRLKNGLPQPLLELVTKAILLGANIRVKAGLRGQKNNIADFVYRDLLDRFKGNNIFKVVIVGTGKIAELFAAGVQGRIHLGFAARKNYIKAQELARRSGGEAFELKDLQEKLLDIDALISVTASPHFIFDENYFRKAVSIRKSPLYLYDLALPRDINPDAGNISQVILNTPDTLAGTIEEYNKNQSANIILAQNLIQDAVEEYREQAYEEYPEDGLAAQPLSYKTS